MFEARRLAKNLALRVADRFATVFPFRSRSFGSPTAVYILMLRPLGLGDVMMLSPFIIEVARRFVGIPTYLVTEYAQFMDLDGVTWIKPCKLVPSLRRSGLVLSPTLSWKHLPFVWGAGWFLGYFLSNRLISNFTRMGYAYNPKRDHYLARAERVLTALEPWWPGTRPQRYGRLQAAPGIVLDQIKNYVCIAPYSNWAEKQYSRDSYEAVIAALTPIYPVVLVGGGQPDELRMADELSESGVVNLVGKTDFVQAAEIVQGASLFIGNDSGLAHAAFLARTPSVVIFGCVAGSRLLPIDTALSERIIALGAGGKCPRFPCYDGFNKPTCKNSERFICLQGVSPDEVIGHAFRVLREKQLPNVVGD